MLSTYANLFNPFFHAAKFKWGWSQIGKLSAEARRETAEDTAPPAPVRRWTRDHGFPGSPGAPSVWFPVRRSFDQREDPLSSSGGGDGWRRWTRRRPGPVLGVSISERRLDTSETQPDSPKHAAERRRLPGTSGAASPAASTCRTSSDGQTGVPVPPRPSPSLPALISSRLARSVSERLLAITLPDGQTVWSRHSRRRRRAGLPHNTAVTCKWREAPRVPGREG